MRDTPQPQPQPHHSSSALLFSDNGKGVSIVKGSKVEVRIASPFHVREEGVIMKRFQPMYGEDTRAAAMQGACCVPVESQGEPSACCLPLAESTASGPDKACCA